MVSRGSGPARSRSASWGWTSCRAHRRGPRPPASPPGSAAGRPRALSPLSASGGGPLAPGLVGAGLAAAGAFGGLSARTRLSRRIPPLLVALLEDGLAIGLALVGVRLVASSSPPGAADPG